MARSQGLRALQAVLLLIHLQLGESFIPLRAPVPRQSRRWAVVTTEKPPAQQAPTLPEGPEAGGPPPPPKSPEPDTEEEKETSLGAILKDVFLLADRALDTVEDVGVHLRRATERDMEKRFSGAKLTRKRGDMPRVLVLGTGWGAHAVVKIIDDAMYEVVVVSPRNFFLFTPMLCSSTVGTIEFRSITEPIRQANPLVDYYEASCEEIFHHNNTVKVVSEIKSGKGKREAFMVPYDVLVYAVGAKSSTFGIPGVAEHCYFIKEVSDAMRLREAIVDAFERASMPGLSTDEKRRILSFVVVGGGPTGIEFSGEFNDFLRRDLKKFYPKLLSLVSFKIIQSAPTILPLFDETLQKRGLEALEEQGINILLNKRVTEVTDAEIVLQGGEAVPYGLCVWAAGTGPRDVTKKLISQIPEQAESKAGKRGKLAVDKWMRVKGTDGSILAIGDCAEPEPDGFPATGQVAAQQGAYVARLLNRGYTLTEASPILPTQDVPALQQLANLIRVRGRVEAPPFQFLNLGLLAYIGEKKALAQVQTGDAIQLLRAAGTAGNLLWRSVYLVKQVSTRNRILVLFDWVKSQLFGRDITRL